MFKKLHLLCIFCFFCTVTFTQNDSVYKNHNKKTELFGSIFPAFFSTYNNNKPSFYSFELHTAQIGAKTNINSKIQGIVLYNVTKTTSDIKVYDSLNRPLQVSYFKGSEYTAFLKQASIAWTPFKYWEFSFGQILSEQYMTVQDKFWGYRYVAFTLQERFAFGHPADFGFRASLQKEKFKISATISNGEGPLSKQDPKGLLMYAGNIEFMPAKNFLVKWYGSIYPKKNIWRNSQTVFVGYKTDKWRIGGEAVLINNELWDTHNQYSAFSAYFSYKILKKWDVFAREDYIIKNSNLKNTSFSIVGIQFFHDESLQISLNQRLFNNQLVQYWQTYLSVCFKY